WTSTWPGPGTGVGTSTTLRTSISPYSSNRTAFTACLRSPKPREPLVPPGYARVAPEEFPAQPLDDLGGGQLGGPEPTRRRTLFECQYPTLGVRACPTAGSGTES